MITSVEATDWGGATWPQVVVPDGGLMEAVRSNDLAGALDATGALCEVTPSAAGDDAAYGCFVESDGHVEFEFTTTLTLAPSAAIPDEAVLLELRPAGVFLATQDSLIALDDVAAETISGAATTVEAAERIEARLQDAGGIVDIGWLVPAVVLAVALVATVLVAALRSRRSR